MRWAGPKVGGALEAAAVAGLRRARSWRRGAANSVRAGSGPGPSAAPRTLHPAGPRAPLRPDLSRDLEGWTRSAAGGAPSGDREGECPAPPRVCGAGRRWFVALTPRGFPRNGVPNGGEGGGGCPKEGGGTRGLLQCTGGRTEPGEGAPREGVTAGGCGGRGRRRCCGFGEGREGERASGSPLATGVTRVGLPLQGPCQASGRECVSESA